MTVYVLQLIHNLKREGAQTMVVNLVTSLDSGVVEVAVFPWREGGSYVNSLEGAGVPIAREVARHGSRLATLFQLRRLAKTGSIDLIHAHMSDSAILAAIGLFGTNVPFIVTHHSNRLLPKERWWKHQFRRELLKWATRRAALNVAVTPKVADRLMKEFHLSPNSVSYIANGVVVPSNIAATRALQGRRARWRASGWPHLVAIGRLAEVKRQDTIVEALNVLRAQFPEARLTIAGDGPLKGELTELAISFDLHDGVNMAGSIEDVGELLQQADFFVSTSSYEGLPIAVLEAMSWGVPAIVSNVPGHRDVVQDGIDGCLVPLDNPVALATSIERLANNQNFSENLGTAAREKVSSFYSATAMAEDYTISYLAAINGSPPRVNRHEDSLFFRHRESTNPT